MEQTKERGGGANESEAFFQKEEAERRAARRDYFLCLFLFFIKKSFPSDSSPVNRCKWGCDEKRGKEGEKKQTNKHCTHACVYT